MAALARASHPALYDNGWHPTAACGGVGAAVAAAALMEAPRDEAVAIALLQAAGLRAAFGSDGKALQVGLAATSGVAAAKLAKAGARVPLERAAAGFEQATGGTYLTAYTLQHGPPGVDSFERVDPAVVERARSIEVLTDNELLESEFVLHGGGGTELVRVTAALGSPQQPMDAVALRAKVEGLAGGEFAGMLDDLARPAAELLTAAGVSLAARA